MTPEKQRIAIAEACGWRFGETGPKGKWWAPPVGLKFKACLTSQLPDYLNDLNAMHEAERVLTEGQQHHFKNWLHGVTGTHLWGTFRVLHATAAQRAEAFLRTLNLWEDPSTLVAGMPLSHSGLAEWYDSHPNHCD